MENSKSVNLKNKVPSNVSYTSVSNLNLVPSLKEKHNLSVLLNDPMFSPITKKPDILNLSPSNLRFGTNVNHLVLISFEQITPVGPYMSDLLMHLSITTFVFWEYVEFKTNNNDMDSNIFFIMTLI